MYRTSLHNLDMKKLTFALIQVALIASFSGSAQAVLFCSEPTEPSCLMFARKFENKREFDNCKREMESYAMYIKDYRQCLENEKTSALQQYNKAVDKFNCLARGESICL